MIRYLIKTTEEYRLDSLEDVVNFRTWLYRDGAAQGYDINSFGYTTKPIKEGKEVIDEYFVVKVSKKFDDEKDPMIFNDGITYVKHDSECGVDGDKNEEE